MISYIAADITCPLIYKTTLNIDFFNKHKEIKK